MATINNYNVPIEAIHPSELIKDELRDRGLKRSDLAKRLDMQLSNLSRFLNKKEPITPQMALKLEEALGIGAETWLSLQATYEKDLKTISERDEKEKEFVSIESVLSTVINLSLLFKQLAIDGFSFAQDRIKELYSKFQVNNTDALIALATPTGRFKRSDRLITDEKNLKTWVLLAYQKCLAESIQAPYRTGFAEIAATEIAHAANSGDITEQQIKDILHKYGIGYNYVPKIEKAHVDAYSTYVGSSPFIITSHRRKNMDMLVFDILHELKHVHTDLTPGSSNLSCNEDGTNTDEKELSANKFAEDKLIPPSIWQSILKAQSKNLSPYNVFNAVINEATRHGISPSIAAWRYKHETGQYDRKGYSSPPIK